jgi:hypothetical protein
MLEDFVTNLAAVAICQEYVMALARPIDAGVPSFLDHDFSPLEAVPLRYCASRCLSAIASRRNLRRSLYWRSESKARVRRGLPTGHRLRPIRQGARPHQAVAPQGFIGCSRRIGSVPEVTLICGAGRTPFRYASLRAASAVPFQKPHQKGAEA